MTKKTSKKILDYIKKYKGHLIIVLASLLVTSSSILIMSHSIGYVIDKAIVTNNKEMLDTGIIYFLIISTTLAIATAIRFSYITLTGEYVIRDIRRDLYKKILEFSPVFYENTNSGEILSRLNTDTTLLQSVISSSISVTMRNLLMLIGSIVMLAMSSLKLTIMMLCLIPMALTPIILISRKLKKIARDYQDQVAALATDTEETVSLIKLVQAYSMESHHKENFEVRLSETIDAGKKRIKIRAFLIIIVISIVFCGIGGILWMGSMDVLSGKLTPGQLSTFIFLSLICATTSMSITEALSEIQKGIGATHRIFEFLNLTPEIQSPKHTTKLQDNNEVSVEFKNVSFSYNSNDKPTLTDISFRLNAGKTLAIVGASGAGKSTIMQLLLRFYDIQEGAILMNDINIKQLSLSDLRSNFGYVGQDAAIFSTSAYHNILYGNQNATRDEVIEAAKAASAYNFIQNLQDGFDTFLGTKGAKLSGGQKQRISIARAILKNPKILLLDEATSALDNRNELLVQKAIEKLMKERTTIVIAHRISTILNANQIIMIKNGKIACTGTHKDLIENNDEYKNLFNIQTTA